MAYNFIADKRGRQDLRSLRTRLAQFHLVEVFPVVVSDDLLTLGISIPLKGLQEPQFEAQFKDMMTYLIAVQEFEVVDLYTGSLIRVEDIAALVARMLT